MMENLKCGHSKNDPNTILKCPYYAIFKVANIVLWVFMIGLPRTARMTAMSGHYANVLLCDVQP